MKRNSRLMIDLGGGERAVPLPSHVRSMKLTDLHKWMMTLSYLQPRGTYNNKTHELTIETDTIAVILAGD